MSLYSIGEVEKITGVKPHVLRYWESVIPFLQPQKDASARRMYSRREIDFIFRIKFLIEERKFTLEGASEQLLLEITASHGAGEEKPSSAVLLSSLRNELLDIYAIIEQQKKYAEKTLL